MCLFFDVVVFFFQAEDGIRDAQESRGLGDVYKRQLLHGKFLAHTFFNEKRSGLVQGNYPRIIQVVAVVVHQDLIIPYLLDSYVLFYFHRNRCLFSGIKTAAFGTHPGKSVATKGKTAIRIARTSIGNCFSLSFYPS